MGANIGTTVTNTIISVGQRNEFKHAFAASTVHDFQHSSSDNYIPIEITFHFIEKLARTLEDVVW